MPVYVFVAGSSESHDFFTRDELERVGTAKQVNQALLSAEGIGEIELLKKLLANKNLMYIMLGILVGILIAAYFSYENNGLVLQLLQRGSMVV